MKSLKIKIWLTARKLKKFYNLKRKAEADYIRFDGLSHKTQIYLEHLYEDLKNVSRNSPKK